MSVGELGRTCTRWRCVDFLKMVPGPYAHHNWKSHWVKWKKSNSPGNSLLLSEHSRKDSALRKKNQRPKINLRKKMETSKDQPSKLWKHLCLKAFLVENKRSSQKIICAFNFLIAFVQFNKTSSVKFNKPKTKPQILVQNKIQSIDPFLLPTRFLHNKHPVHRF